MTYPYPSMATEPPSSSTSAFGGCSRTTKGEAAISLVIALSRAGVIAGLVFGHVAGREASYAAEPTIRAGL